MQRQDHAKPLLVAHRGASADAPENTLSAFQLAWQQGVDAIEGDFHLTGDGEIVCRHDPALQLVSGSKVHIKNLSLVELKSIAGESVPTLKQVLEIVPPNKSIFIEIKCGPEIIPNLLSRLRESDIGCHQVTVIAFNEDVIAGIKKVAPHIKSNWLVDFKGSLMPLQPPAESIISTLKKLEADGVGLEADFRITSGFVRQIHAAGYTAHVWTVDSCALAQHFYKAGVDSITTNVPALLRTCLNKELNSG